jgi:acetyltransferase
MHALLRPESVAIVGDSPGAGRGGWIHDQLVRLGYDRPVYPVNPKYREVRGLPCYPSLLDIPAPVEFVAVAVGAGQALRAMEECVKKQARAALFIASGFAESGPEGKALQDELRRLALAHDIAVCGPNCYGIANVHERFVAYSGSLVQPLRPGPIALLFQSGALTHSVTDPLLDRASGYSYIITTGNEAVAEIADYVDAIADDPRTRVIACFVEGFKSPGRFFAAARRAIASGKRLVVLKTGRSELGQRAALAHTGALTGPDDLYDALFRQLGIARVRDLDELIETAELLGSAQALPHAGPAVVSISGGSCGVAADLADTLGLPLPALAPATAEHLRAILPPFATANNPLDLTGAIGDNPAILSRSLAALADDPGVGLIALALNTPAGADEPNRALYRSMCRTLAESAATTTKQHLIFSLSSGQFDPEVARIAREAGVPLLMGLRETLAALAHARRCAIVGTQPRSPEELAGPEQTQAIQLVRQAGTTGLLPVGGRPFLASTIDDRPQTIELSSIVHRPWSDETTAKVRRAVLSERLSKQVLAAVGIAVPRETSTTTPAQAVQAAEQLGYPVVLKVDSPDIPHKTEAGCVRVGLGSAGEVADAYQAILNNARRYRPNARIDGVLVQEQVRGGVETLVGVTTHADLGPAIVFGLGGILVEALQDWAMRAAPITREDAAEMIGEIRAARVLQGWRGGPALDIAALEQTLVVISQLAWQLRDQIAAIDINPLVVLPRSQGVKVLDALIVCV